MCSPPCVPTPLLPALLLPLQYVVETRFVGEKEKGVAGAEIVDVKDRVVDVAEPGATCPVNTGEPRYGSQHC